MNGTDNVPQRETEGTREFSKLRENTQFLEQIVETLNVRLTPFLRSGGLKAGLESAKNPENSSKFAQELNIINNRLRTVANVLDNVLGGLEI